MATSSINNDRETMVPMLNNGTAPEIIYYLQTTVTYFYGHFYCRGMIGCSIDIIMPASKILRYFTCVSKPSNTGFMLSNVKISLARKAA